MMDDMNESEEPWDVDPIKLGNLFFSGLCERIHFHCFSYNWRRSLW